LHQGSVDFTTAGTLQTNGECDTAGEKEECGESVNSPRYDFRQSSSEDGDYAYDTGDDGESSYEGSVASCGRSVAYYLAPSERNRDAENDDAEEDLRGWFVSSFARN